MSTAAVIKLPPAKATTFQQQIDRLAELDRDAGIIETEMKDLKPIVIAAAESDEVNVKKLDSGGRRCDYRAADGTVVRVTFPADSFSKAFPDPAQIKIIKHLAGRAFDKLFEFARVLVVKGGVELKSGGPLVMEKTEWKKLLPHVSKPSAAKLSFETK